MITRSFSLVFLEQKGKTVHRNVTFLSTESLLDPGEVCGLYGRGSGAWRFGDLYILYLNNKYSVGQIRSNNIVSFS